MMFGISKKTINNDLLSASWIGLLNQEKGPELTGKMTGFLDWKTGQNGVWKNAFFLTANSTGKGKKHNGLNAKLAIKIDEMIKNNE